MKLFPTYKNDYDSAMIEFVTDINIATLYWNELVVHEGNNDTHYFKKKYCIFRITKDSNETT